MEKKQKLIGKTGIYAIVVQEGEEKVIRYIGSGVDLESRKSNHWSRLRNGTHIASLQELYDEVGEDNFHFYVIDTCCKSDCFELEKLHKQIHEDTIYNLYGIRNTKKKVRRGKEAVKHKEKFRELFAGSKNPNASIDEVIAGEIKWLKENTEMKQKDIASMYEIRPNIVSRIGKDRWLNVEPVKPEGVDVDEAV